MKFYNEVLFHIYCHVILEVIVKPFEKRQFWNNDFQIILFDFYLFYSLVIKKVKK